jgi:hypothetical protein
VGAVDAVGAVEAKLGRFLTFLSFSIAAFSFFSHFLAERAICFDTIRRLIISSSMETLLPIVQVVLKCCLGRVVTSARRKGCATFARM